jgi:hypothetical protein
MIRIVARSVMPTASATSRSLISGSRAKQMITWLWLLKKVQPPATAVGLVAAELVFSDLILFREIGFAMLNQVLNT